MHPGPYELHDIGDPEKLGNTWRFTPQHACIIASTVFALLSVIPGVRQIGALGVHIFCVLSAGAIAHSSWTKVDLGGCAILAARVVLAIVAFAGFLYSMPSFVVACVVGDLALSIIECKRVWNLKDKDGMSTHGWLVPVTHIIIDGLILGALLSTGVIWPYLMTAMLVSVVSSLILAVLAGSRADWITMICAIVLAALSFKTMNDVIPKEETLHHHTITNDTDHTQYVYRRTEEGHRLKVKIPPHSTVTVSSKAKNLFVAGHRVPHNQHISRHGNIYSNRHIKIGEVLKVHKNEPSTHFLSKLARHKYSSAISHTNTSTGMTATNEYERTLQEELPANISV